MKRGRNIWVVFRKEMVDNLRDRRSVFSASITPLFMPLFLVALIMVIGKNLIVDPIEKPLFLPVVGAQHAPSLIQYLEQNGVTIQTANADPESTVRTGAADVIVVISPDFGTLFKEGNPAAIDIIVDSSRQSAAGTVERVRNLLAQYNSQIASLRLLARGVSPQVASPLAVNTINVATPQSQTLTFLNMMPFLIVVVIFMGGMYVIIDTTAGERERGSLEPLLINPATREEFVLGKLLASLPFACATLMLALFGFWVAFDLIPLEKFTGFPLTIDVSTLLSIFYISLPMILLASGLQVVIATFTHSFKEAQTYLALLPLVAGLPGAFLTFLPIHASLGTMFIPAFSQSLLINQAMRGEPIQPAFGWLSAAVTMGVSLLLVWVAIRLYQNERVIFGN
ncbi:MAG: ABC transporter permease [Anaerolineaceae bacterium]|nr:ABC transporter permease [Anaerolineaceae bacterium]